MPLCLAKSSRLLLGALTVLGAVSVLAADKPNIVVIWGDDIGFTKFEHL